MGMSTKSQKHLNPWSLWLPIVLSAFGCVGERPPQPTAPANAADRCEPPSPAQAGWSRYTLPACAASVEFPSEPHALPDDDLGGGVIRKSLSVDWPDQPNALELSCAPIARTDRPVGATLDRFRDRLLAAGDLRLVDETVIPGGRKIVYDDHGAQVAQRVIVRGKHLIVAVAVTATVGNATAERFLASLRSASNEL
jgi:hypothetical protein